ncbi:unnamed protein product [Caenorhabditis bovis]|uniref:Receptor ligand binding region domain-containing protein n=1 Tax=Caenorhabditis bovis TaxID=2654633 RepID=A0A8S1EVN8_9PELO|nr:unnamed protein product [Caenorhabditis bovis]
MIFIDLIIASFLFQTIQTQNVAIKPKIKVGICAVQDIETDMIGFAQAGGAVAISLKKLQERGYLNDFDFEFVVEYTECDRGNSARVGLLFMRNSDIDVIIGPPCPSAISIVTSMATIFNKLVLGWGFVSDSEFSDMSRYPNLASIMTNSLTLGYAVSAILEKFSWEKVALLYMPSELKFCEGVIADVEL